MTARGSRDARRERTDAERARLYQARTAWHEGLIRRRKRDTVISVVVGLVIVAGAIVSQIVLAQVNAPAPAPSPTVSETPAPAPSGESTDPAGTPSPTIPILPSGEPEPVPTQTLDE